MVRNYRVILGLLGHRGGVQGHARGSCWGTWTLGRGAGPSWDTQWARYCKIKKLNDFKSKSNHVAKYDFKSKSNRHLISDFKSKS
jgi:hypothetical protein